MSRWIPCATRALGGPTSSGSQRVERAGDAPSAEILRRIYRDEIGHVAIGWRCFDRLCRVQGLVLEEVFRDRERRYFKGI